MPGGTGFFSAFGDEGKAAGRKMVSSHKRRNMLPHGEAAAALPRGGSAARNMKTQFRKGVPFWDCVFSGVLDFHL